MAPITIITLVIAVLASLLALFFLSTTVGVYFHKEKEVSTLEEERAAAEAAAAHYKNLFAPEHLTRRELSELKTSFGLNGVDLIQFGLDQTDLARLACLLENRSVDGLYHVDHADAVAGETALLMMDRATLFDFTPQELLFETFRNLQMKLTSFQQTRKIPSGELVDPEEFGEWLFAQDQQTIVAKKLYDYSDPRTVSVEHVKALRLGSIEIFVEAFFGLQADEVTIAHTDLYLRLWGIFAAAPLFGLRADQVGEVPHAMTSVYEELVYGII